MSVVTVDKQPEPVLEKIFITPTDWDLDRGFSISVSGTPYKIGGGEAMLTYNKVGGDPFTHGEMREREGDLASYADDDTLCLVVTLASLREWAEQIIEFVDQQEKA